MDKGPEANCLVAYAIQFGDVTYKHDTHKGSQWMVRLAAKLKNEEFLQQILREVKEKIPKLGTFNYIIKVMHLVLKDSHVISYNKNGEGSILHGEAQLPRLWPCSVSLPCQIFCMKF